MERDFIGYRRTPTQARWAGDAKIIISVVINSEPPQSRSRVLDRLAYPLVTRHNGFEVRRWSSNAFFWFRSVPESVPKVPRRVHLAWYSLQ